MDFAIFQNGYFKIQGVIYRYKTINFIGRSLTHFLIKHRSFFFLKPAVKRIFIVLIGN